jgi:hypothetical protein
MRRFSIRNMMGLVVVSAIGLAALRNADAWWAGILSLLSVGAVGVAMLGAIFLRGREQAWWTGFAFFAGGYLALAVGPGLSGTFQSELNTTQLLRYIHGHFSPKAGQTAGELQIVEDSRRQLVVQIGAAYRLVRHPTTDPVIGRMIRSLEDLDDQVAGMKTGPLFDQFQRVGHSLFALLAGLVGALIAGWFYTRRTRAEVAG